MVTLWYPAEARAGVLPGAYVERALTLANPSYWNSASTVAEFVTHAFAGLPLASNQMSYPVLIYSHGYGHRRQNTDKAEELASHGYVVVAVEHREAFGSVFPDGEIVRGPEPCLDPSCDRAAYLVDRLKDYQCVLDELSRLNGNGVLLAVRLDLERLGAFGWSWGGATVGEFCRTDARCKAVVLLDAGYLLESPPDLTRFGIPRPFLSMNQTSQESDWLPASETLFARATKDGFWFQIRDSTHDSVSDNGALISNPTKTSGPTPASRAQSQTIRACMVSFFDKYLKGEDDQLLDDPAAVYPNIINLKRR